MAPMVGRVDSDGFLEWSGRSTKDRAWGSSVRLGDGAGGRTGAEIVAGTEVRAGAGAVAATGISGLLFATGETGERICGLGAILLSDKALRDNTGRFPTALALNPGGAWSSDLLEPPESGVT